MTHPGTQKGEVRESENEATRWAPPLAGGQAQPLPAHRLMLSRNPAFLEMLDSLPVAWILFASASHHFSRAFRIRTPQATNKTVDFVWYSSCGCPFVICQRLRVRPLQLAVVAGLRGCMHGNEGSRA